MQDKLKQESKAIEHVDFAPLPVEAGVRNDSRLNQKADSGKINCRSINGSLKGKMR